MRLGARQQDTFGGAPPAYPTIKERALARTTPPATKAGRYRPPDRLIAFLEAL